MSNPVNWFQISAKDAKPLNSFYKKVFSWKMDKGPMGMQFVAAEKGGIPGGLANSQDGKSSVAIYVNTDNIVKQLAKIEKAGGKTAMPPMPLPEGMGTIAGFLDPAGNWIGLWEPGTKPAKSKKKSAKKKAAGKRK